MKKIILLLLMAGVGIIFSGCKKDKPNNYDIPVTYDFIGVDYSDQKHLLDMLTKLTDEMKRANTAGVQVDAQVLKDMYANVNKRFTNDTLNSSGVSLKAITQSDVQHATDTYLEAHAASSQSLVPGSNGVAGVVRSGILTYLDAANGFEHTQFVGIGLLGSAIYYQVTTIALSDDRIGAQVPLADRQHHWDEAFGWFGVPVDFPAIPASGKWLGKYSNLRDPLIGTNAVIMNAFIKGRAAIDHGDNETVNEQVAILRNNLEKVMAAGVVHYCNESLSNATDNAVRNHSLSEGISWSRALKFNPTRKITDAQIAQIEAYFGNNFYMVSTSNIIEVKNLVSSIYGFNQIQQEQL